MAVIINLPPLPVNQVRSVSTIAELRAVASGAIADGTDIIVDGGDLSGDGFGGLYIWSETSTIADNDVTVIRPNDIPPLAAGRWILTGGGLVQFVQEGTGAVGRSLLDKAQEILSPADFGVTADGVNSDVAFAKLIAAANSSAQGVAILLPAGDIALSNVYSINKNVTLVGRGMGISRFILGVNARLRFVGSRQGPFNRTFSMTDFSVLVTGGIHTSSPLYVDYIEQGTGEPSLTPTLQMRNIVIAGATPADGFAVGLELVDCPWPKLDNVVFRGDNAFQGGYGIRYTGAHGSPSFLRVRGIYLKDFIWCSGEMEGYVFDDCECLAVQRGVYVADTTAGLQPLVTFTKCHINCEEYCIKTVGMDFIQIDETNVLYGSNAMGVATTWTCVDVTPSLNPGPTVIVCHGTIRPTVNGQSAWAPNSIGVRIRGSAFCIEHFNVGGVCSGPMSVGVQLDADTNGVLVEQNISMINVVTKYINSGNNIILGGGYIYPVALLPTSASLRPLEGLRLVVGDASGGAGFNTTAVGGGTAEAPVYRGTTEWKIG